MLSVCVEDDAIRSVIPRMREQIADACSDKDSILLSVLRARDRRPKRSPDSLTRERSSARQGRPCTITMAQNADVAASSSGNWSDFGGEADRRRVAQHRLHALADCHTAAKRSDMTLKNDVHQQQASVTAGGQGVRLPELLRCRRSSPLLQMSLK